MVTVLYTPGNLSCLLHTQVGDKMLMRIHKRRYLNALKKAAKINRYLKKGYHVFYLGERIEQGFVLEGNQIVLKLTDNLSVE